MSICAVEKHFYKPSIQKNPCNTHLFIRHQAIFAFPGSPLKCIGYRKTPPRPTDIYRPCHKTSLALSWSLFPFFLPHTDCKFPILGSNLLLRWDCSGNNRWGQEKMCIRDREETVAPRGAQMMVTPREIDLIISRASRLVAMSIDAALHPDYSPMELLSVASD